MIVYDSLVGTNLKLIGGVLMFLKNEYTKNF
jgi:hypothetical protein